MVILYIHVFTQLNNFYHIFYSKKKNQFAKSINNWQ